MKLLILSILILFFSSSVFAEGNSYKVDLDNDGREELIVVDKQFETTEDPPIVISGLVTVFKADGSEVGSFIIRNYMGDVETISLNRDGSRQIVAWSFGGAHYTNIAIYGYNDGRLYKIFENGSAGPVKVDFEADEPIIKVGRANWEQKSWCYATGEPLWQVYVWSGEEFIYDEDLSTTPEISEEEEVDRYVNKVMNLLKQKENQ